MNPDTEHNYLVFTLDNNSDHIEKFSLLVDYLKEHYEIEEISYSPAFWQNGHFHFKKESILYRLDFDDMLGLEIKLDISLPKQDLDEAEKFIELLKEVASQQNEL